MENVNNNNVKKKDLVESSNNNTQLDVVSTIKSKITIYYIFKLYILHVNTARKTTRIA